MLPKNIEEWYKQFLQLAKAHGVDVDSRLSGIAFQNIEVTSFTRVRDGETETAYRDDHVPISAPLNEARDHIDDPLWLFENTQPISRLSEEQILNLYNLAKDGKVMYTTSVDVNGEYKNECHLIYTGTDLLPHFSGPLSQGPLVYDRDVPIADREMALMEPTFPNAPDQLALAELSTRSISASNLSLTFALSSEERGKRLESAKIFSELLVDSTHHPDYYDTPEKSAARSKMVATGIFNSINGGHSEIPQQYRTDEEDRYQVSMGVESNIKAISTAGMSLDDMISAGLIRRADGTPFKHGAKPWDARNEIAATRDEVISIYRPGENGGEPQLDGTLTLKTKAGLVDFIKTRTERSTQKKVDEATFKGVEAHKTVYGGVKIAADQKRQLENQPAAEFLAFDPLPNENFNMRYKLPEMGRYGDSEFHIRENMNYFIRGAAGMCFDQNGNFDLEKYDRFSDYFTGLSMRQKKSSQFAELMGVPEEKQEDFSRFVSAMEVDEHLLNELTGFDDMVLSVRQFQFSLDHLYRPGQPVDAAKEKFLMESYGDFQKKLDNLRKMSTMDPATETHVYNYLDCGYSASINRYVLGLVNSYRENHGQSPVPVPENALGSDNGKLVVPIERRDRPDDPVNGNYYSFGVHACFGVNARLNGRDVLISLETTAPKTGKLLFSDSRGETGAGIFKDRNELVAFHCKDSYYHVDNMDTFIGLKNIPEATAKGVTNINGSHIMDIKLRTGVRESSHTMEELSARLNTWKVDHPLISSSPEFVLVKEYFKKASSATTPEDSIQSLKRLNIATQLYLDYKDPKGDAVKTASMSDYANRRLSFARDVLDYTSARLNQQGVKIPIAAELRKRKLLEHDAPEAPVKKSKSPDKVKKNSEPSLGKK